MEVGNDTGLARSPSGRALPGVRWHDRRVRHAACCDSHREASGGSRHACVVACASRGGGVAIAIAGGGIVT
jgi:hypothetical protein